MLHPRRWYIWTALGSHSPILPALPWKNMIVGDDDDDDDDVVDDIEVEEVLERDCI